MKANIAGKDINLKIDTGSQANLMPLSLYRKIQACPVKARNAVLRSYNGGIIKQLGTFSSHVTIGDRSVCTDFFVIKKDALLGLKAAVDLGLIKRNVDAVTNNSASAIVDEFPQLFQGTGRLQREYRITLREGAVPVIQPARRVPLALREPLRAELQRMEAEGIIQKEQRLRSHKGKTWTRKAKVLGSAGPRSFHVRTEDRNILRRNREHLLETSEPFEDTSDEDYDEEQALYSS
ncbi:uncharacterized protein LOC119446240 [Dermacentor silvarum]|uniref:uncharacterized protein LOC119446240 n=1 Tax=Dermacentor silvarum TaxID=543639 RepID=UPI001899485D|nr:uncharacterized protein LOC119446240 [Dermacentor silvarum]